MKVLYSFLAALLSASTGLAETIDNTHHGFTITIPSGWRIIPQSEIATLNQSINNQYNLGKVPSYKAGKISDILYGYQPDSDHWFSYPYMLVRINRAGKKPESELRRFENSDLTKSAGKILESMGSRSSNINVGKGIYDRSTRILWSMSETTDPDVGKVCILDGAVQTEEGAIWIDAYASRESFETYKSTFLQIIESVRPIDSLLYKADLEKSDSATHRRIEGSSPDTGPVNAMGTGKIYRDIGAVVGITLSVIVAAGRKRKQ